MESFAPSASLQPALIPPPREWAWFLRAFVTTLGRLWIIRNNLPILFIYLFMAALGYRRCVRAFSSCGEWGPFLIVVASLIVEHRL